MSDATSITPVADGQVAIATLLRPQGRRGELLAEPLTDLEAVFTKGRRVQIVSIAQRPATGNRECVLEDFWMPTGRNAGKLVLKLSGCDSIDDAEGIAGCQITIPADDVPTLDEDTYFVGDLIGCAFFNGLQQVGTIADVEFPVSSDGRRLHDAAPLLVVQLQAGDEPALVPFVRAWLDQVDLARRRVTMRLPDGLLDGGEIVGEADTGDLEPTDAL